MKAFAKTVPVDRIKGRGGKKKKYCPCCISSKTIPGSKNQKSAIRQQLKRRLQKEDE